MSKYQWVALLVAGNVLGAYVLARLDIAYPDRARVPWPVGKSVAFWSARLIAGLGCSACLLGLLFVVFPP